MVKEDDAGNPTGSFRIRDSKSLPLEGQSPAGWNSAQDRQGPDASSVIPSDPYCRIRLFQSYDLRRHHWDKGGDEPERCDNSRRLTTFGGRHLCPAQLATAFVAVPRAATRLLRRRAV